MGERNAGKMNQRQKKLLEELPKNDYILSKAGIKAGYSPVYAMTSLGTTLRKSKKMREYFDEGYIKKEFKKALKDSIKEKDRTNRLRALESMARIKAMFTEKSEVTNKNPEKIVISYTNSNAPKSNGEPVVAKEEVVNEVEGNK